MAIAQPLLNQKKHLLLFLPLQGAKDILTTNTRAPEGGESQINVNANANNGISEDARRLCQQGRLKEALKILRVMDQRGIRPDSSIYDSLLQDCVNKKSLPEAKLIHTHMIDMGFNPEIYLGTKLVIMYAKCGNLVDAREVLEEMPERNVVSWTAMIAAYAKHGYNKEALALFYQMRKTGIQPDQFAFASVLSACANLADLEHGKKVHGNIITSGLQSDVFLESALGDMYIKCDRIEDARQVFDKMPERDVVSWNGIIAGYGQNGHVEEALRLFQTMPVRDVVSWNAMIMGYAQNGHLGEALKLFQKMPERNVISWNTMITGYAQNGQVDKALSVFEEMPEQNVASWNTMIAGYAQNGCFDESLKLFRQMQLTGVNLNSVTLASVLPACANLGALKHGKEIHAHIIRSGSHSNIFVDNALVDMYAKCRNIENARRVFDKIPERTVVSWTAMVAGYAQNGFVDEALKLFQKMPEQNMVSWNTMIRGYAQNGLVDEALEFFQKMPEQNVISWNMMITGYTQNGYFNEALNLFRQMKLTGMKPNSVTFVSVLPACANLAALENGKEVHEDIIRSGLQGDIFVGNALVDMYAKCGRIEDARKVFDKMPERVVVSWNAMIVGYAMNGCGEDALQLFEQMQHSSIKPNHVTFVGVLSACCHAGLVDDAWQYFDRMSREFNVTPEQEHYCCMVDLLGRAGHLDEAQDFINKMPIKPNAAVWGSLLAACRIHTDIELGEHVAERLSESDPENAAHYVLLSNIYAAASRWDDVQKVRKMMKERRVKKRPGCSWIEVNNKVYAFVIGDRSHPQSDKIYAKLDTLLGQMKEVGYVPDTNFVLHDVEDEQKEHILCHHSEKLAIVFGLIQTSPHTPIRIVKNLRVCGDCHSAIKLISKIVVREIIVRDASRFHHFKDGYCSCGDYW